MAEQIASWTIKLLVNCPKCRKQRDVWCGNLARDPKIEIGRNQKDVELECTWCGEAFKADLELRV